MNKKMFIVVISLLAVFFLSAQTCMQGVTTGLARDCVGENDIVCDDTEAYQCQMAQFGIGFYVTKAPRYDVECGAEPIVETVSCINQIKDGSETDVDCGGPDCRGCLDGFTCAVNRDCAPFLKCDSQYMCAVDPYADVECTSTDVTNCLGFTCNVNECYSSCTAGDAECATGYACSVSLRECLADANNDGVADVEETTATATCSGPLQSEIDSMTLGTVIFTDASGVETTVTDSCVGNNLYQVFCNAGNGYTSSYGPTDCTGYGAGYICSNGACVASSTSNTAPVASCTGIPTSGQEGAILSFYGYGTDVNSDTLSYRWGFGDGTGFFTEQNPTHTYSGAGNYWVSMQVTDDEGLYNACTKQITITSACISALDCSSYGAGYTCELGICTAPTTTSTCTDSDGGRIYTTQGTITGGLMYPTNTPIDSLTDSCDSSGQLIEYYCSSSNTLIGYTYNYPCSNLGSGYTCSNGACVASSTSNTAPVARCLVSSSGQVGISAVYDGSTSSDADLGDILTYAWDFNEDGVVDSILETGYFAYSTVGTYIVTLTVTDDDGATDSCTQSITISAAETTTTETCDNGYNSDASGVCYISCSGLFEDATYFSQDHCAINYDCNCVGWTNCACEKSTSGGSEICADSDSSSSSPYFEPGTMTVNSNSYSDYCSSDTLYEYDCNTINSYDTSIDCSSLGDFTCILGECVAVDRGYSISKLTEDYTLLKLAELSVYQTGSSGYLTTLDLENEDYTTTGLAHITIDTGPYGGNYLDLTSSITPRYVRFETGNIPTPEHWLDISADVKSDSNDDQIILAQFTNTCGKPLYSLWTQDGEYVFTIYIDGVRYQVNEGDVDNSWQTVRAVYTGSTLYLYVEDVLVDYISVVSGDIEKYSGTTLGDFVIGYSTVCNSNQFTGYIDDIYIYGE